MATIKMPSEIAPQRSISCLIYGQPGIGKTTLACSSANAVLFDYDNGVNRINPAHMIPTVQVESWEDTHAALQELDTNPALAGIRTIVIDTVGKMLDFMSESIMRNNPKMKKFDGTLSLQGYGQRKKMFSDFVRLLAVKGKNVVFVAHEKEEKNGDDTIKRPLVGGSSASDLLQELDLVGYMQARGNVRTITFNPSDAYYAKNSCYIPDCSIPVVVEEGGLVAKQNCFMETAIFGAFRLAQDNKMAITRKFNALISDIEEVVAGVSDLESLNAAFATIDAKEAIFDSRIRAGKLLNAKAGEIGAKFDKTEKRYVVA